MRHVARKPAAEHDHARDPEEENVEAGNQEAGRIKGVEVSARFGRDLRPAKDGDRQQARREPGVENIGLLRNLLRAAVGAGGGIDAGDGDLVALRAVPCGNAMAPPELARDAPVVNVLHPLEVGLLVHLRREADVLLADGCLGLVGQRLNLDEPLRREARLDRRLAAVAVAHVVDVVLDAGEQALFFQVGNDFLAGGVAVEARICAAFGVDVARVVHNVDRRQDDGARRGRSRWGREPG